MSTLLSKLKNRKSNTKFIFLRHSVFLGRLEKSGNSFFFAVSSEIRENVPVLLSVAMLHRNIKTFIRLSTHPFRNPEICLSFSRDARCNTATVIVNTNGKP